MYECAIGYAPRTAEEGKKINWKDGVWALYCIIHYGGSTAPLLIQLAMYSVIGGICALLNLIAFSVLVHIGVPVGSSVIFAFAAAAALNYLLCITFLFEHRSRWSTPTEVLMYLLVVVAMGASDYILTLSFIRGGIGETSSKLLATSIGFALNFIFRRFLVFPKQPIVRI